MDYRYVGWQLAPLNKQTALLLLAHRSVALLFVPVSTVSSDPNLDGSTWGNIRSVVDGVDLSTSSGMPVFYLPTPDPTTKDIESNSQVVLTFTEAALSDMVGEHGQACLGVNPGDPDCGQVMLHGTAVAVPEEDLDNGTNEAFRLRHPLAPWLSDGGSHTGGQFLTIEVSKVMMVMSPRSEG